MIYEIKIYVIFTLDIFFHFLVRFYSMQYLRIKNPQKVIENKWG